MQKIVIACSVVFGLAACATTPTNLGEAQLTPANRIYEQSLSTPRAETGQIIVLRDKGFAGSGCMMAVYLDGMKVAAIDNGEALTLHVPTGAHILGVGPNPGGIALCKFAAEKSRREVSTSVEAGKTSKFRFGFNRDGDVEFMPTAF